MRYAFGQDDPGEEHRGDGIEIDIVGHHYGTQLLHGPVPREETEHGGHTTQEQKICQHVWTEDDTERRHFRPYKEVGNHGQQSIYEHLTGDENRVVTLIGRDHQQ